MIALALAAVFVLERASPSCDGPFAEIAQILDYQAPDYYRYVDHYIDNDVLPLTSYCYRISGACGLNAVGTAHDQVDVWWTREMPETTGVRWNNRTTLTWNPYDRGAHGENPATITYEVVRGVIGDWSTSTMTSQAWSEGTKYVGAVSGTGAWFLVRARNACGAGAK